MLCFCICSTLFCKCFFFFFFGTSPRRECNHTQGCSIVWSFGLLPADNDSSQRKGDEEGEGLIRYWEEDGSDCLWKCVSTYVLQCGKIQGDRGSTTGTLQEWSYGCTKCRLLRRQSWTCPTYSAWDPSLAQLKLTSCFCFSCCILHNLKIRTNGVCRSKWEGECCQAVCKSESINLTHGRVGGKMKPGRDGMDEERRRGSLVEGVGGSCSGVTQLFATPLLAGAPGPLPWSSDLEFQINNSLNLLPTNTHTHQGRGCVREDTYISPEWFVSNTFPDIWGYIWSAR